MKKRSTVEIERKFLVYDGWDPKMAEDGVPLRITQGYLPSQGTTEIRVRIQDASGCQREAPTEATLCIKAPLANKGSALVRAEYEYKIPEGEAMDLLKLCDGYLIEKDRYEYLDDYGQSWDVDVFRGDNAGLVIAEIELEPGEALRGRFPGTHSEVTHSKPFGNRSLALHPYKYWEEVADEGDKS